LPKQDQSPPKAPQFLCQLTNISECLPIEGQDQVRISIFPLFLYILFFEFEQFTLTLWNPTGHTISHHVRVPVTKNYSVRDSIGHAILAEVSHKIIQSTSFLFFI
jgi:hypothetical protein